jgi:hypothetical protein
VAGEHEDRRGRQRPGDVRQEFSRKAEMNYEEFRKESEKSGDLVAYMITEKKPRPGILGKLARKLKYRMGGLLKSSN